MKRAASQFAGDWNTVTNSVATTQGRFSVTLTAVGSPRSFRLRKF